jgi:hypothetical protein
MFERFLLWMKDSHYGRNILAIPKGFFLGRKASAIAEMFLL